MSQKNGPRQVPRAFIQSDKICTGHHDDLQGIYRVKGVSYAKFICRKSNRDHRRDGYVEVRRVMLGICAAPILRNA